MGNHSLKHIFRQSLLKEFLLSVCHSQNQRLAADNLGVKCAEEGFPAVLKPAMCARERPDKAEKKSRLEGSEREILTFQMTCAAFSGQLFQSSDDSDIDESVRHRPTSVEFLMQKVSKLTLVFATELEPRASC